jgi:hypothetical protein
MLKGDGCRGISKNDVAFRLKDASDDRFESAADPYAESPALSTSMVSGVPPRGLDADFGDGDRSRLSGRVGLRSNLGRIAPGPGVEAKWDRFPWPRLKPLCDSVRFLNASNSRFESTGRGLGDRAPKERIEEVGELQLSFGPTAELLRSVVGSTTSPK